MAGSLAKGQIGKEDLSIQTNANATETFERLNSTGGTIELEKFPDIWGGEGKIKVAEVEFGTTTSIAAITETIAAGTLTHDILKTKINEIITFLTNKGMIS